MCIYIHLYVYMYSHTYIYNVCTYVCLCVNRIIYIYSMYVNIYTYIHGHTRIFALGLLVDLGMSPCSNFAALTALCALCENESSVSLWF